MSLAIPISEASNNFVVIIIIIFINVVTVILLLRRRSTTPPPAPVSTPQSPNWALTEGYHLIEGAAKKAETILTEAELEGIKVAEQAKMGTTLFERDYREKLAQALDEANKQYQKYLIELESATVKSQTNIDTELKQKVNQVLFNFEGKLSGFLSQSEQKSMEAINLELKSARTLIDTYRQQQLQLIDENIVAVLERTLSLVMRQKLTLRDQLDMVYEALEKAKIEKFFA